MWFCSLLCSWFCHMFAARDSSLWVRITQVSVCYSPVQRYQNILPHFLKCLGRAMPWAPGFRELPWPPCNEQLEKWLCLIPLVGSVAPGHQMGMGLYSFPSLFLGLTWMGLQAVSPYRLVSGSVGDTSIFLLTGLDQHVPQNKLNRKMRFCSQPYPSNW